MCETTRHGWRRKGTDTVDLSSGEVETELVDLTHVSLSILRERDHGEWAHSLGRLMEQLDSARANIGEGGGPGRVD